MYLWNDYRDTAAQGKKIVSLLFRAGKMTILPDTFFNKQEPQCIWGTSRAAQCYF